MTSRRIAALSTAVPRAIDAPSGAARRQPAALATMLATMLATTLATATAISGGSGSEQKAARRSMRGGREGAGGNERIVAADWILRSGTRRRWRSGVRARA
jgi:hypothetical protein